MTRREVLEATIERIAGACEGIVALATTNLRTGETLSRGADRPMPPASAIKVVHLVELMWRVVEGRENLEERVEWVMPEGFVAGGGSGIMQFFRSGLKPTLWDLAVLMTVVSDNLATQLLFDRFGSTALDERMASIGVTTRFSERPKSCLGGNIAPADGNRLMAEIGKPHVMPKQAADLCVNLLKFQQFQACLCRWLPDYVYGGEVGKDFVIASKVGYSGGTRTDFGLCFSAEADWSIAVMTDQTGKAYDTINPTDRPGMIAIARIGRAVHDYFRGRPFADVMNMGAQSAASRSSTSSPPSGAS